MLGLIAVDTDFVNGLHSKGCAKFRPHRPAAFCGAIFNITMP
jgi:hypothetical protein